jgi:hypothetical protein
MKISNDFKLEKYGLSLRLVNEIDAEFIIELRTNPLLSKYLNPISIRVTDQKEWIKKYKDKEKIGKEYYFIFSKNEVNIGLERLYSIMDDTFTHGSLIFTPDAQFGSSILADIITREIGFEYLNIPFNLFDVRKGNISVLNYHKTFGAEQVGEDQESLFFKLHYSDFNKNKERYLKMFNL